MTTYTITVTDSLGATANYSFEVVENPSAPAVPDFIEAIELRGAIAFGGAIAIIEPIPMFGEIGFGGSVTVEDLAIESITLSGAIAFAGSLLIEDTDIPLDGAIGFDGQVTIGDVVAPGGKTVTSIDTTNNAIQVDGGDFDWLSGTLVEWSTTGTLPTTSPQVILGEIYYLAQYSNFPDFLPEYQMYRDSDFAFIDFVDSGSGTHTLTEI